MFLFADEFFYNLTSWRTLWIAGRLGGGKTLLAVAVAEELLRRKVIDGVIANFPHALQMHDWRSRRADGSVLGIRRSCVIFDEAWQVLDRRTFMSNARHYGAFARKLETVWIFPSVIPIDSRLSIFSVRRTAVVARKIWFYRWSLETGDEKSNSQGFFILVDPQQHFGKYDTSYIPTDDADIGYLWGLTVQEITGHYEVSAFSTFRKGGAHEQEKQLELF